jgi:hypothetical protein
LLPLLASSRTNGVADIGLVMAAFNGGGLTAPMGDKLADRFRLHQQLLIGGILGTALGVAFSPLAYRFYNGYGGGQVVGLVLAGLIGQGMPEFGLLLAGGIGAAAIIPAVSGTRQELGILLEHRSFFSRSAPHAEWPANSPQHLYHHVSVHGLRTLFTSFNTSFGIFLISSFLSFSGSAAFLPFYPVLMRKV